MIYEFMPTQDLHGYDKPWAPGANINRAILEVISESGALTSDLEENSVTVYNTSASAGYKSVRLKAVGDLSEASERLYFYGNAESIVGAAVPRIAAAFYDSTGATRIGTNLFEITDFPFTRNAAIPADLPEDAIVCLTVYSDSNKGGAQTKKYYDLEIAFETFTDYTPYSNICMPQGFNIWDPYNAEYIQVYAGYVNANTRELYLRPVYQEYAGEELVGPWMSSLDPYDEDTTPTEGAFVIDFGGELQSFEITPFMLQTLLDSLGIRQHFTDGAGLLNSLMDQAQGRVRSEEELLHLSRPLKVIAIGDQLPAGITIKPISKDVLPGLPGKFIR